MNKEERKNQLLTPTEWFFAGPAVVQYTVLDVVANKSILGWTTVPDDITGKCFSTAAGEYCLSMLNTGQAFVARVSCKVEVYKMK